MVPEKVQIQWPAIEIVGLKLTAELHSRVEELESLNNQMQAARMTIAKVVSDGTLIINHETDPFPSGSVYS